MSVSRPLAVGVTALLALGAAATGAAAADVSSVTVSAAATNGSRQFLVEDLTGAQLTALDLGTSGQGQLFQTRVKDTDYTAYGSPFTASMEMTNLYKKDGAVIDYATMVPSSKIAVGYASVPTDLAGVNLAALPTISVAGLLPKCGSLSTLLNGTGSSLLSGTGLLDPVLGLVGLSGAAAPLCNALGGSLAATGPAVEGVDGVVVPLAEEVLTPALDAVASLPVSVTGSTEAGNFANASYLGAGADDTAKSATPATARKVLAGTPNGALDLASLVSPLLDGLPLFSADPLGTDGLTSVSSVVSALQASTDGAVASVGNALAGLSALEQTRILSGLTEVGGNPIATLADTVLDRISGTYRSFPRLTADLNGAPTGTYTGTMTITFVQE